ncbi:MAG: 2-oxoglutarate dehydrogenase E1 subunit family protein [Planctomycetota bacterium]
MQAPDFEEVFGLNAAYAEKVYGDYLDAPESVPAEWRSWFETELPPEQRAVAAAPADGRGDRARRYFLASISTMRRPS